MRRAAIGGLVATLGIAACQAPAEDATDDTTVDVGDDTPRDSGEPAPAATTDAGHLLVASLAFATQTTDGVTVGFDLDALGSGACGIDDQVDAEGHTDLDNAFAFALDRIVDNIGWPFLATPQDTIDTGRFLQVLDVSAFEAAAPGDCVPVQLLRATGRPVLGGAGQVLAHQTLDVDDGAAVQQVACGRKVDADTLTLEGFTMALPLELMGHPIPLTLRDARARLHREGDAWTGVVGAAVSAQQFIDGVATFPDLPPVRRDNLVAGFASVADLRATPDGPCTLVSTSMAVEAVPVFLFDAGAP
ncbi:MAG: hypothetical protein H6733_10965 [Alphaproteobacteria bacterium]|nr:hypothetical protein [Alphaproteobacteria bacterium]